MKKYLFSSLSVSLLVFFLGGVGCEPPAEQDESAGEEVAAENVAEAAQAEAVEAEAVQPATKPIEIGALPDEKERMSELLKMEQQAAETAVTEENAEEVAARLEAEIEADLK